MSDKRLHIAKLFKSIPGQHPCLLAMGVSVLVGTALVLLPYPTDQSNAGWCLVGIGGALWILWLILRLSKKLQDIAGMWLWWGIGACMRLGFILRMPYNKMQHDVWEFTDTEGHAGYIMYLFRNGHLPDFDVRLLWQFYHPPLHHIICACWMHLMTAFGLSGDGLYESMQVVPFVWSSVALMVFGLLLRELGLQKRALILPMAVMALHPSFIYLGGALNNDMLCILLMLTALLFTVRWYKKPTVENIIPLALSIGFSMMAKLSGWLAAPAAAVVFLIVLFKNIKKPLTYIKQYGLFLLLCVPEALFWEIRNAIRWGVPLAYIPMLDTESNQYVGNHPIWERLFDFSPYQFSYIYDCFVMYKQEYNEFNPLVGLLKTAVFDEYVNTAHTPAVAGFGDVLFWSQAALAAAVLICMVVALCKAKTPSALKLGLALTYGITVMSYYSFCFAYAHTCTQSARYATPAIYAGLLFLGIWSQERTGKPAAVLRWGITGIAGVFIAASAAVYGILMFIPTA